MHKTMEKSFSRDSESSTQFDSPHSPMRSRSSPLSDGGDPGGSPIFRSPENSPDNRDIDNSRAIVLVENFTQYSPVPSPSPVSGNRQVPVNAPTVPVINRAMRHELPPSETNVEAVRGGVAREDGGAGRRRGRRVEPSGSAGSSMREEMAKKAALGFRLSEVVLCLISFSVMAADKTQGWSGDSFDRYKEYRYCLSVNVIAFVYAGFQVCDLAYQLVTGKHIIIHHLRYHFDFFMDQVLAYLLISASSSAATRVDDWQSNWGKDQFTEMASASVGLSFLAFVAFAISSLISGYNLCSLYP